MKAVTRWLTEAVQIHGKTIRRAFRPGDKKGDDDLRHYCEEKKQFGLDRISADIIEKNVNA